MTAGAENAGAGRRSPCKGGASIDVSSNLDNLPILMALLPGLGTVRALLAGGLARSAVLLGAMDLAQGAEQAVGGDLG